MFRDITTMVKLRIQDARQAEEDMYMHKMKTIGKLMHKAFNGTMYGKRKKRQVRKRVN